MSKVRPFMSVRKSSALVVGAGTLLATFALTGTAPTAMASVPCKSGATSPEWQNAATWNDGSDGSPKGYQLRFTNKCLFRGQTFSWSTDDGGTATLDFQNDGNVVLYDGQDGNPNDAVWATGTYGDPKGYAAVLSVQTDGNMVLYDLYDNPLWASGTWGCDNEPQTVLALQADGNMVIYTVDNFNNGWWPKWDAWGNRNGCH